MTWEGESVELARQNNQDEYIIHVQVLTRIRVKHRVGAATLLIHMLAKQETPMNESNTVLGRVPAKLSTRVINTRSMLVLLSADAMVKPPIRSMMVGENMTEKMYLENGEQMVEGNENGSLCCMRCGQTSIVPVRGADDAKNGQ